MHLMAKPGARLQTRARACLMACRCKGCAMSPIAPLLPPRKSAGHGAAVNISAPYIGWMSMRMLPTDHRHSEHSDLTISQVMPHSVGPV